MEIYAGIDCGTQGTKVIIIDVESCVILGTGSAPHQLITDANGRREQHVSWWTDALCIAFRKAVSNANISPRVIKAISVSGQQHGFIPVDKNGRALYPAKLWCDTETNAENILFTEQAGGEAELLKLLGLVVATGYTASKIIWFKKHYPDLWKLVHRIYLPHEYINYWLTGESASEYGDASGTGFFDIRKRAWCETIINLLDDSGKLLKALPPLVSSGSIIGKVNKQAVEILGLNPQTSVACGSGDNMMGAIGTGNIASGIMTMGLGTSGTLYSCTTAVPTTISRLVANFCSATDGWLPLVCTMNVTSATTMVQKMLNISLPEFNRMLSAAEPGADGVMALPFFNGERVPALPEAQGGFYKLNSSNCNPGNICRAVVESATFGLRYGFNLFKKQGIIADEIRLTGGGATSNEWRQIVADIMGCSVVGLSSKENTSLGAAIHAAWSNGEDELENLSSRFVKLDYSTYCEPDKNRHSQYDILYEKHLELLEKQYPGFDKG
ncbi:xylulokinase [Salmonella enterica]|nr:xylulokinase [Salmonella enterica]EEK4519435.1 xylulokinase [Salmonella enterica]EIP9519443.1 xylulokinase [Salmonella enterica]